MKKYRVFNGDQTHEITCDKIKDEDGDLYIFLNDEVIGLMTEWDNYYQLIEVSAEESCKKCEVEKISGKNMSEEMKRFLQGFSYKPPKCPCSC